MMDPGVALPLHFTAEAVGIGAAGLLLAWALIERRMERSGSLLWVGGAAGALALGVAQALHAGQFLPGDDDAAVLLLRLAGLVLLGVAILPIVTRRWLAAAGLSAVAVGAIWGALASGGVDNVVAVPHIATAAGSLVLVAWVWGRTGTSLRLRVVAAFIAVLSIATIVGGGAVARAAALEKRNALVRSLGEGATATQTEMVDLAERLERRAAALSPRLATDLAVPDPAHAIDPHEDALPYEEPEAIIVFDRRPRVRADVRVSRGDAVDVSFDANVLGTSSVVGKALAGTPSFGFDVARSGGDVAQTASPAPRDLLTIGGAPVFAPGDRTNVLGAVIVVRGRTAATLRLIASRYEPRAHVQLVEHGGGASLGRDFASTRALPGGRVDLVISAPRSSVVDATSELVQAVLIAILAAALLAVIIGMWLADRVARPIVDLADEADRAKAEFLSVLSHELRTPLTPIRGYTDLLRNKRVPARSRTGYLDEIGQAAVKLERIVTLLVDVASMETGRFWADRKELQIEEVLTQARDRWAETSSRHQVRIELPRSLPPVLGDRKVISRVLDELIDNAVKFSPDGGEIELHAKRTDARTDAPVEIGVTDNGIGIDAEQVEAFTQAFTQADAGDTRRFGGLGLGLTYIAGALAAHDSGLKVVGEPGEGSTFSFTLATASSVTRMPARAARRGNAEAR